MMDPSSGPVLAKLRAITGRATPYVSSKVPSTRSLPVPRGRVRALQHFILGQEYTVKKYAATNRATCARGRLLFSGTILTPTKAINAEKSQRYALSTSLDGLFG
jgi:hypothetical protein